MSRAFVLELVFFSIFKFVMFIYIFFVFGGFTQLGDNENYLKGAAEAVSYGSTFLMLFLGQFLGGLGFLAGNLFFYALFSVLTFLLLRSAFTFKERLLFYFVCCFPSVGVYSSIFGKEAFLVLFSLLFFWSLRKRVFSILFLSMAGLLIFKPVLGVVMSLWLFVVFISRFLSYFHVVWLVCVFSMVSLSVSLYFLFSNEQVGEFVRNFHLYFSGGNTSFSTRFYSPFDVLMSAPYMISAWFVPQSVEFLDLKFILFDVEGYLFLCLLSYLVFPFTKAWVLSSRFVLFWVFLGLLLLFLGPYVIFNLGSTLRYRSSLFVFAILFAFEIRRMYAMYRGGAVR